jgi:hypothetical protein
MSHLHGSETWPNYWPAFNATRGRYEYMVRKFANTRELDNSKSAGMCEILAMRNWVQDSTLQLVQHLMYKSGTYDDEWSFKVPEPDAKEIARAFGMKYMGTSVQWIYGEIFFVQKGDEVFKAMYSLPELQSKTALAKDGNLVRLMIARMGETANPDKEAWIRHARETIFYLDKAIEFRRVDIKIHDRPKTAQEIANDQKRARHVYMRRFLMRAKSRITALVGMMRSDSGTPQQTSVEGDEFIQYPGFKLPNLALWEKSEPNARKRYTYSVVKNDKDYMYHWKKTEENRKKNINFRPIPRPYNEGFNEYGTPVGQLNTGIKRLKRYFQLEDDENWLLKQAENLEHELIQQRERQGYETIKELQLELAREIQANEATLRGIRMELTGFQAHAVGSGVNYDEEELDADPQFTSVPNMFSGHLENTQHHELIMHCVNFYTAMHIGNVVGLQCNYNALRKIGDQLPVGSFNNGTLWEHIETEIDAHVQRLDAFSYGTPFAIPHYLIAHACIWREDYLVDTCWLNQCRYNHEKNSLPGMPTFSQSPYMEMEP